MEEDEDTAEATPTPTPGAAGDGDERGAPADEQAAMEGDMSPFCASLL